jgi:hypothetical protein
MPIIQPGPLSPLPVHQYMPFPLYLCWSFALVIEPQALRLAGSTRVHMLASTVVIAVSQCKVHIVRIDRSGVESFRSLRDAPDALEMAICQFPNQQSMRLPRHTKRLKELNNYLSGLSACPPLPSNTASVANLGPSRLSPLPRL